MNFYFWHLFTPKSERVQKRPNSTGRDLLQLDEKSKLPIFFYFDQQSPSDPKMTKIKEKNKFLAAKINQN